MKFLTNIIKIAIKKSVCLLWHILSLIDSFHHIKSKKLNAIHAIQNQSGADISVRQGEPLE